MKKVFVIIVTYKGKQWYDRCFGSLRTSTIPIQTIVVDNTPEEEDAQYIWEHFPEVHLIKPDENLGFGKANNLGLRYALDNGCDYVFLLNQDAWLIQEDVIEKLVQLSENHPEYGIISPMHMTADEQRLSIQYENENHTCSWNLINDLYCGTTKEIYETDYVNAAAWFIPRRTIEKIGGFNPLFQLYGEDDDYLNRVHYHKLNVGICPGLKVVHDHEPFSAQRSGNENRTQAKELLVKLLDINHDNPAKSYQRYFLRRLIQCVFKNDRAQLKYWKKRWLYIKENKTLIKQYRELAKQGNTIWL